MPVFDSLVFRNSNALVWKIEEREEELKTLFAHYSSEKLDYQHIVREEPRKQKIASRLVTAILCEQNNLNYDDIYKDKFEKPHFKNSSFHISISHTKQFAVAVVSKNNVGIDIEYISDKIQRIKHKFCNEKELLENTTNKELIQIWGAKEAMYKAYGKKQLLFAEEMNVLETKGTATKNNITHTFDILYKTYLEEVCLVIAEDLINL